MGMNSKDIIVFFSLIWFCYFFFSYCVEDKNILKNLILSSFFVGFGCGVRLTFLVVIFPVIMIGISYLIYQYKSRYLFLTKRLSSHILIASLIIIFLIIVCWPQMIVEIKKGNFLEFFSLIVKNTINWNDGPKLGLLNGNFYAIHETPKTYLINFILFRLPYFFSLLFFSFYFFYFSKNFLSKNEIKNFRIKFIIVNVIIFFPIFLTLILKVNIYDNIRLFLFIIPFLCLIAAFL